MANRLKEDEKNERIIRNLLKLPENRRCINCNSLGTQYVCTNFSTFVCTTCSGIHREFTHRVKSVSMAKFTSQEISALQGGGNASAKQIYLKEWDPQRNSLPDGSNVMRLRDFIKHVYVDRRYTGERNFDKPVRTNSVENENFSGNKRTDTFQSGSRSPPFGDKNERGYNERLSSGGRSPEYGEYKRSPAHTELVNDWRKDDRFGNGRRSDDGRISDGGSKFDGKSPDLRRDTDGSSPPVIRPVRDILGDNVTPLRVIEPPKASGGRTADGIIHTQRTASSSSLVSSDGNTAEPKLEASLIDFDDVTVPPVTAQAPELQQSAVTMQQASASADNWANFDSVPQAKTSEAPLSTNSLESMLSGLSVTDSVSTQPIRDPETGGLVNVSAAGASVPPSISSPALSLPSPFGSFASATASVPNSGAVFGQMSQSQTGGWTNMQPAQQSLFHGASVQPAFQPPIPSLGGSTSNQHWNSLVTAQTQGPPDVRTAEVSQAAAQVSTKETRAGGRKELPEDLFAANYSFGPAPVPVWYMRPPLGAGFPMQYNMPVQMPSFQQQSRSINPFDAGNEPLPLSAPTFPPMASSQPNMVASSGLLRTSSLGLPDSRPFVLPAQAPSYASSAPPSPYMGQQVVGNVPPRPLGTPGFAVDSATFGPLNPGQQLGGLHSAPATSFNAFPSAGGNPFG